LLSGDVVRQDEDIHAKKANRHSPNEEGGGLRLILVMTASSVAVSSSLERTIAVYSICKKSFFYLYSIYIAEVQKRELKPTSALFL